MPARAIPLALLFLVTAARAADPPADDPVAGIQKAKASYAEALGRAKRDLLSTIDEKCEQVKANKVLKVDVQIAQLEKLEAAKEAFETTNSLPTATALRSAAADYRAAIKKAQSQVKAELEKAATAYRDKGDFKKAAVVLEELKDCLQRGAGAAVEAGYFVSRQSGKVFGPAGKGTDDGTRVVQLELNKGDAGQLWRMVPADDGWFWIENVRSQTCLSTSGEGTRNGEEIILAQKQEDNNTQLWKLVPAQGGKEWFYFQNRAGRKSMGPVSGSPKNGIHMRLWDRAPSHNGINRDDYKFVVPK